MINGELFKEMQNNLDKTVSLAKMHLQFQEDLFNKIYSQLAPLTDWFKYCITCVTGVSDKLGK